MASANMSYVPYEPYNETAPDGGNSFSQNLNLYYQTGDIAWIIMSTALVLPIIPGIGFFYSGLARRKSALSMLWLSLMAVGVSSFQWSFWGYSLAFSHNAGSFLGDLMNFGYKGVLAPPSVGSARIPDLLFAVYQGIFANVTASLTVRATFERGRLLPCVIFVFLWSTLVYSPIAAWIWNPHGWIYQFGGLDFAGGTVVHISSGSAALAYSYALGKRSGFGTQKLNYPPHNVTHIVSGTMFLWIGWFGFSAGSALSANLRAVMAAVVTNLSASVGGITWCLMDYWIERKFTTVGFCSGVVAGLVTITPGSGYVPAWAGIIFGVCGATVCNFSTQIKHLLRVDDALDIFAVHTVGGLLGDMLTGIFAADYIAHLDGYTKIPGGWINGNWVQPAIQLAAGVSGMCRSFYISCLVLTCLALLARFVPALRLRVAADEEEFGIDQAEIGERAYDYLGTTSEVELARVEGRSSFDLVKDGSRRIDVAGLGKEGHVCRRQISGPLSDANMDGGFF